MYTVDDFQEVHERIKPYIADIKLRFSQWLSDELDAEVYLKFECFQPGRSFKIRGASNALLSRKRLPQKVITASGGNHGLGVAIIAKELQVPCLIVLPEGTSGYRLSILEELGAEILLHGKSWDDSNRYAMKIAKESNHLYIHPFADLHVIQGQGTVGLEIVEEITDLDAIIASVGGGGLLTGISLAVEAMGKSSEIDIYSVETIGAASLHNSIIENRIIELDEISSIAKTLSARKLSEFNFHTLQRLLTKSYTVTDEKAVKSLIEFLDNEKILVEPAMSCIISALLNNKEEFKNKKIVVVVCGSNVTFNEVEEWKKEFLS